MFAAIAEGFILGLMLACFFGPIFFLLLDLGVNRGIKPVIFLSLGVFASDFLFVLVLYFVLSNYISRVVDYNYLFISGGLILIYFGLAKIFKTQNVQEKKDVMVENNRKIFFQGFAINILNPSVFLFWFGSVMVAKSKFPGNHFFSLLYFLSALIVVVSTDIGKGFLATQLRKFINPGNLGFFSKLSGFVFVFYGVKLFLKAGGW